MPMQDDSIENQVLRPIVHHGSYPIADPQELRKGGADGDGLLAASQALRPGRLIRSPQIGPGAHQIDVLINAAQAGSLAAFEKLYELHAGLVFRTALSILKNHGDAEDAMQDTFLRAYRGLRGFRREAQFHSWITRIAINSSLMILRKSRRRSELSIEGRADTRGDSLPVEFVDGRPGPDEVYGWNEANSILLRLIESLPNAFRSVVEERLLRERSTQEAAEVLGISRAAAKSRLLRAKLRMGKAIRTGRSRS